MSLDLGIVVGMNCSRESRVWRKVLVGFEGFNRGRSKCCHFTVANLENRRAQVVI